MSRTEYKVMSTCSNGRTYESGQYGWIPDKEVAEKLKTFWIGQYKEWGMEKEVYLLTRETDEPDNREPMTTYEDKPVYNWDHVY